MLIFFAMTNCSKDKDYNPREGREVESVLMNLFGAGVDTTGISKGLFVCPFREQLPLVQESFVVFAP